jgi:hypothetical protein
LKKTLKKITISLGDDGAIISAFSGDTLTKRLFVTSTASTDFIEFIKANKDSPIYLLLDIIDQNYIFSNLPMVGKKSVNKIIKRKIKTEFDENDINAYLFLGKDLTSAKKSLKYLFVSIRNSSPFKDWLDVISGLPNKFEGIYLVPVESEKYIETIRRAVHGTKRQSPDEWEILISYNRVGGFRQIVLKNGRLIFTRISQSISLQTPDSVGKNISQEGANTIEYIRRIGYYDQSISVYVVCAKEAAVFIDIAGVRPKDLFVFSPYELAKKINLESAAQEGDKYGDILFSAHFLKSNKILKLSNKELDNAKKLFLISKLIKFTTVGLLAILPLVSVYNLYRAISSGSEIKSIEQNIETKKLELEKVKDFKKEYNIEPNSIVDIVKFRDNINKADEQYIQMLKKFGEITSANSRVENIKTTIEKDTILLDIQVLFEFDNNTSFSDVLVVIEKFTQDIKSAYVPASVEFTGLPKENDIKVDLGAQETQQLSKEYLISVRITSKVNNNLAGAR